MAIISGISWFWKMIFGCIFCLCLALHSTASTTDNSTFSPLGTPSKNESESLTSTEADSVPVQPLELNSSCRCSDNLCLSEECILAASTVLSSLDRTADPCEDFYQFACGGWIKKSVAANTDRWSEIFHFEIILCIIPINRPTMNRETVVLQIIQKNWP